MIAIETNAVNLDEVRAAVRQTHDDPVTGQVLRDFHELFYKGFAWSMTTWCGVPALKNPCDLFSLQDIVAGLKPALIIETGTAYGGAALFLAHVCDLVGAGSIVSIDLEAHPHLPQHPRISYLQGSSVDPQIVAYVRERAARCGGPVLVLLDSDHHAPHVSAELAAYADLVTPGSFVVVEDTNVNGHPILPEFGPGPAEAVAAFLADHPDFEADPLPERYLCSMHPGGWLRRRLV